MIPGATIDAMAAVRQELEALAARTTQGQLKAPALIGAAATHIICRRRDLI